MRKYNVPVVVAINKFHTDTDAEIAYIKEFCEENGISKIGTYKLAGFDASADHVGVSYFYTKPPLTKTEAMILRYLICSYPIPQNSDAILRHSFRSSRAPESSSIRTHISSINKKLTKISGRKLIELIPKQGYLIVTPQIIASRKIM
jgi:formyltetrahydrofolate synthetase